MAPFKLKFRMGSSRSTSQEHDPDPQVNEALLNKHSTAIGTSSSTIDSADCTSLGSLGTNERKSLLPTTNNKTNNLRLGYLNSNITQCTVGINSTGAAAAATAGAAAVPQTPPPSYEHVLEENTRLANTFDLCPPQRQQSTDDNSLHSRRSSSSLEGYSQCTDPDCLENIANEQHKLAAAQRQYASNNNEQQLQQQQQQQQQYQQQQQRQLEIENAQDTNYCVDAVHREDNESDDNRKESIDSRELLLSTNMTSPSSQGNTLDNCNGDCQNGGQYCSGGSRGGISSDNGKENNFCDPLMNLNGYCSHDNHHYTNDGQCEQHSCEQNLAPPDYADRRSDTDSDDGCWDTSQMSNNYQQQQQQQHQQQQQQQYEQHQYEQQQYQQQQQQQQHAQQEQCSQTSEIISNKSSKEIYKDLAKQWGITCKMSDGCRCMECQSHYFDCEYDDNEHNKTDGGLGAGTPMFISEVMHGTACTIL